MAVQQDRIASTHSDAGIASCLGVDYLQYQDEADLVGALEGLPVCTACFTGNYPTRVDVDQMAGLERGRAKVSGEQAADPANKGCGAHRQ
jgi:glutamine phosphoribosylpyrophosphate amidotransferase